MRNYVLYCIHGNHRINLLREVAQWQIVYVNNLAIIVSFAS